MDWTIYYADGATFTGSPFDAPGRGVVVIIQSDPLQGWRTIAKYDYYVFQSWGWEGVDIFGLWDYLIDPGPKTVKFGRTLPTERFEQIFNRALREAEHG